MIDSIGPICDLAIEMRRRACCGGQSYPDPQVASEPAKMSTRLWTPIPAGCATDWS